MFGRRCPHFESKPVQPNEIEGWISAELEENGWTTIDGKHYCPQHNPAAKGTPVTVHAGAYTEVAPGVNVRLPVGSFAEDLVVEVQRFEPSEAG